MRDIIYWGFPIASIIGGVLLAVFIFRLGTGRPFPFEFEQELEEDNASSSEAA